MKRVLIFLTAVVLAISCFGCAKRPSPTEGYPDYTFKSTPTTDDLRATAVRAMRDLLSIQWTPADTISYFNTAGRDKQFDYKPGKTYGGLLYTGASTGLFHFLEFYDQKTGVLTYPGTGDELRRNIGSGCADSLLWGWATVSNSFSAGYYPSMMVYKNGFLPVGDYTYDFNIQSYYNLPTKAIIENNGDKIIYDSYTKVLPADALISSSVDHAMMVIENPTVVYASDGTIDTEKSFVIIQDQRGGTGKGFLEEEVDGKKVYFNSARHLKMTFKELHDKNYIPVTVAEFIGEKEYEKASVSLQGGKCKKLSEAQSAVIESNYPIAVIRLNVRDNDRTDVILDRVLINSADMKGPARTYDLSEWETLQNLDPKAYKKVWIEVIVSTGECFTVLDISV